MYVVSTDSQNHDNMSEASNGMNKWMTGMSGDLDELPADPRSMTMRMDTKTILTDSCKSAPDGIFLY